MTDYSIARQYAEARYAAGWRPAKLLSQENVKLQKGGRGTGYGLSLAPAKISGYEVCASRSPACTSHCIFTSGHGRPELIRKDGIHTIWWSRILKTMWLMRDRQAFLEKLCRDVANHRTAAIRLNVFSDWQWERQQITLPSSFKRYDIRPGTYRNIFEIFPETQFYDYTKHYRRMFRELPLNYHLTFSLTEANRSDTIQVLKSGLNVAAVVSEKRGTLFGFPILDGDEHDLRFLDPSPYVIGLSPKGSLKTDLTQEMVYDPDGYEGLLSAA